jgi:hypothetical protein
MVSETRRVCTLKMSLLYDLKQQPIKNSFIRGLLNVKIATLSEEKIWSKNSKIFYSVNLGPRGKLLRINIRKFENLVTQSLESEFTFLKGQCQRIFDPLYCFIKQCSLGPLLTGGKAMSNSASNSRRFVQNSNAVFLHACTFTFDTFWVFSSSRKF